MKHCLRLLALLCALFLVESPLLAQYILNGSAEKISCNCYTLTRPEPFKSGSVWNSNKINLNTSFDFWFNVNLGCTDAGADGIVFILQPVSTSVGSSGEGMGFGGISPSIGIALDTYQNSNLNDPSFDHISIQSNGTINHSSDLAGPVPVSASSNNIEDCQWHKLRISWDAGSKWLRTYFDGVLRLEKQVDLVATVFNNDPQVYWGFTGATGGAVNLQQFCTALDPIIKSNLGDTACQNTPLQFSDSSESFAPIASYLWNFGDGTGSSLQNPQHTYVNAGTYNVGLKITGMDGCEKDTLKKLVILPPPVAQLSVWDTCFGFAARYAFPDSNKAVLYQWLLNGLPVSNLQEQLKLIPAGQHQLQLTVTSIYNCGVPQTASSNFIVKPLPQVSLQLKNGCVGERIQLNGVQTDGTTTINQWSWLVGTERLGGQMLQQNFQNAGTYPVKLWAAAANGCTSDTAAGFIKIAKAELEVNDTSIIKNKPTQLRARGSGTFLWSPATGLSDPLSATPVAQLQNDQQYTVTITTPEGCQTSKTILVKVFNGVAVYVPSAFTPNGDGKNDRLLPVYVGVKELKQFAVFNRWGGLEFRTQNMQMGWKGRAASGTYIWLVQAVTIEGKPIALKGTVTILQ